MAFANREKHKSYVVRQLHPENSAFGVVAVSGSGQVGKSYFWSFVQFAAPHLKVNAVRIDLEIEIGISAQGLFNLITNESGLPPPQGVQVDTTATPAWQARELVGRLVGWARAAEQAGSPPLWIMIDHLDKAWPLDALSGAQEFILYLAEAAKSRKVSGLRLFLVGLPQEVTPPWLVDDQGSINIDPLTPEDVEYWLRQELAPADYSADLLKAKALTVLDGRKRALHRRLESAVTELRAQLGGGT